MRRLYYIIKPILPRRLQIFLRRWAINYKKPKYANIWPIDEKAGKKPSDWNGWPDNKKFALVLTHDVDTVLGHDKCLNLIALEQSLDFVSSFNFVAERYVVSHELRQHITSIGFEVGVHGLYHDGKLYESKEVFKERAVRINQYIKDWGAVGFRSPSMHHNLDWIHELNIEYDASTFDTDPFEPQPDGVNTIFPFYVKSKSDNKGYVELPYTLPQDFTLFVLMGEKDIKIWKRKLDWIAEHGGMALLNTHPDYMNFNIDKHSIEEYPAQYYLEFLEYVQHKYKDHYWHGLPKDIARFYARNLGQNL